MEKSTPKPLTRTWTDIKGKTINGELIRAECDFVELKVNEKTARVPIARLSDTDQKWITSRGDSSIGP